MTDPTPALPPPDPDPGSGSGSGGKGGMDFGSLSQGEKLVGLGAAAVLAVYIIFELITEDYFVAYVGILLAVFILGVLWFKLQRPGMTWEVPTSTLLRAAGYLLFVFGLVVFIDQVKDDIFDADGGTITGALILWAGCALTGFGANRLD
jgi:hypothetical protein